METGLETRNERIARDLVSGALAVNEARDGLRAAIQLLDNALQKLNTGVAYWHPVSLQSTPPGLAVHLGYAPVRKRWGVSIRVSGSRAVHLAGAPMPICLEAIPYLGEMLEGLVAAVMAEASKAREGRERVSAACKALDVGDVGDMEI